MLKKYNYNLVYFPVKKLLAGFINNISETCTIKYNIIQLLEYTINKLKDKCIDWSG